MSITCPRCGITSQHPTDEREGYCGRCHDWTVVPVRLPRVAGGFVTVQLPTMPRGSDHEREAIMKLLDQVNR